MLPSYSILHLYVDLYPQMMLDVVQMLLQVARLSPLRKGREMELRPNQ